MIEKALLLALVALALVAAASAVGGALSNTLGSINLKPAQCAAHAKDTCQ